MLTLVLAACGGSSPTCHATEVEVDYLGGASDGKTECKAIPAACGATAACVNDACRGALYNLCAAPYNGVGCSDTVPPTIVSCNP